jgi:hypothetical protein
LKQYFFVFFIIFSSGVFAQNAECEKIYEAENLTKEAVFSGSKSQFMKLMMDSVLSDLKLTASDVLPTRLKAKVTIDSKGHIIDSFILTEEFEQIDKELINKNLLKLDKWLPAEIEGQAVCSYYYILISCILWN